MSKFCPDKRNMSKKLKFLLISDFGPSTLRQAQGELLQSCTPIYKGLQTCKGPFDKLRTSIYSDNQ